MKNLIKRLLLGVSLLLSISMFAQQKTFEGTITDELGSPLPGATITVKGTINGVSSDFDGNFIIKVEEADILLVSYVGYQTKEIPVKGINKIKVVLLEDANLLDEVVVVGFGTQKRENVTGATSFVKMDEIIADRPIVNSAQALQGVSAGLQVVSNSGQPGSTGTSLNIRGFNSINGGSPLVLVDNVPMSLSDVNPRDIESVSVLKDASSASIYGARAAFGVVLITTKKASRNEAIKATYSTITSFSSPSDLPEKATTKQFVNALNDFGVFEYFAGQKVDKWLDYLDIYENDPSSLTYLQDPVAGTNYPIAYDDASGTYYPLADSNQIDDFINNFGYSVIHNFGVSGGSEKSSFRINGGYSNEDGIMVTDKDSYTKYNVNAYLSTDVTSKIKSETSIYYRNSDQSRPSANYASAIQNRMYDPTGFFETSAGDVIPFESPGNIVRYNEPSLTERNNLRFFEKMTFTPIENLSFTGEYTYSKSFTNTKAVNLGTIFASPFKFIPNISEETSFDRTRVTKTNTNASYKGINLYSKYKLELGNHSIDMMVGFNKEENQSDWFGAFRTGLISPELPSFNLAINENYDIYDSFTNWAVVGYFSRLNYNYKDKYFLEVNGRYDGSSRFPDGSQYVFTPSFSGGWNLAKESFMENVDFLSMLKLRGSWGEIGNQQTPDLYPSIPGYEDYNASWVNIVTDQQQLTFSPAQLVSNAFTWEKIRMANVGVDAAFFKNRLNTSIDLYSKKVVGMLSAGQDLPAILGTDAPDQNIADLETRGWEFELKWNDRVGDLKYGVNFNLSNNEAHISKFYNESGLIGKYYEGKNIHDIWGYVTDGYYTADDFVDGTLDANLSGDSRQLKDGIVQIENSPTPYPGDIKYKDLNGDGIINNGNGTLAVELDADGNIVVDDNGVIQSGPGDRKVIGNSNRKYQFGVNGYAEYKGFDMSFILSGVAKRDLWRDSDLVWPYPSVFDNIYKHQLDYWTPDNQNAYYPRIYGNLNGNTGSNYGRSRYVQTKYLSNESYLKIQNITFGYTFDQNVLDKLNLTKLRLFVSGNNLYTFDNLPKGLDPDQGSNGVYPVMKNYSLGLNLTF